MRSPRSAFLEAVEYGHAFCKSDKLTDELTNDSFQTAPTGKSFPVNYRIYDKRDGKTKNQYLREMIAEVKSWGLTPKMVTADSWYSSLDNLKFLKNQELGFLMGVAKNRKVCIQGKWIQVNTLDIPPDGLEVYLKQFGRVMLYRNFFKKMGDKYYI